MAEPLRTTLTRLQRSVPLMIFIACSGPTGRMCGLADRKSNRLQLGVARTSAAQCLNHPRPPLAPDEALYQILPLRHLPALLAGKLTLVQPATWEDPFEALPHRIELVDKSARPVPPEMLDSHLPVVYAQCWSRTGHSDALLRAYSRVQIESAPGSFKASADESSWFEGVKITTTLARLRRVTDKWSGHAVIRPVNYMTEREIDHEIHTLILSLGLKGATSTESVTTMYLMKRKWFAHENEVRLICVDAVDSPMPLLQLQCDPNDLIHEMTFDPRLPTAHKLERQAFAQSQGYRGTFDGAGSDIYQGRLCTMIFPQGWPR